MPKEICNRLDNIERELQLLLLMQTASSRIPERHSCDSSDSNEVIYCTPANCADVAKPDAVKSGHEMASENEVCPCPPPGDERHAFLKDNVFVSVKTGKQQALARSVKKKKAAVLCNIRTAGRYEQPERPCLENCQGICNSDEPQRDESCHPECEADCNKMAPERDEEGGAGKGKKGSALEERCRLLEQQNAELHALLESNRAQVRESVQSKELALAMARQLKERNDALRAEKEQLERGAQAAQTRSLDTESSQATEPTAEATLVTPEPTLDPIETTPESVEATPESVEATPESADATPETAEPTTAEETPAIENDVGVVEGVVTQEASNAAEAVPSLDEHRVRLAEARVEELELQWRTAEDQVREAEARAIAAEERARLAEARLDEMDKTCDCHGEEAAEGEQRNESAEFFDAEDQPKSPGKENEESVSGSPQLKSTSKELEDVSSKPASKEVTSGARSSTSKVLSDRKSSKSSSKGRQSQRSFTAVLQEAVSQSERLKSLSQELLVAKSDSQRAKLVSATLMALENRSKQLEQEVAELQDENQQLFREASDTAQCCTCAEEVERLRSTTAELDRVLSAQQERIGELQEINNMQEKLVQVQQQQMNSKEEQVRLANQEVEVVRQKSNDLDEQVKRLRTSIESFERVQTAGEEREGQAMQEARTKIAQLTAEVDRLRKSVDDYKRQLDDCKSARSQSGPVVGDAMSDESCHCDEMNHCPCLDDDDENGGVTNPCSVEVGVDDREDADFQKFQRDALQAKQEVELIRKRSSELGDVALERSVRSIEHLRSELQKEQQRSAEKIEAVTSQFRASLEKEQDKVLIKDKIVEDQAATIRQLKELQKRLERDLQESNQRAAQLLMQLKVLSCQQEAQRREKDLTERLRHVEDPVEDATPPVCTCDPCHEQLDAQDAALQQLEVRVAVKQREWEHKMRAMQKDKAAAIAAARFATVKLVEATNEFRRQLAQHKEVQQMLATVMAERQTSRKKSPNGCICNGDEDLSQPPQEGGLGVSGSWSSSRRFVYQRQITAKSPPRSSYYQ